MMHQLIESCIAFFFIFMAVITTMFAVCALRTNIIFFYMFVLLVHAEALLAASYWASAQGNAVRGQNLQVVSFRPSFPFGISTCLITILISYAWHISGSRCSYIRDCRPGMVPPILPASPVSRLSLITTHWRPELQDPGRVIQREKETRTGCLRN